MAGEKTHQLSSTFSESTDILIGLYIVVILLLSVVANSVVLVSTIMKKKITDMDIITINICICQSVPAILSYPLVLVSAFSHGWSFSEQVRRENTRRVRQMLYVGLGACYLYGLMWALPPILGWGSYTLEPHQLGCALDWTHLPLLYMLGILVLGYALPMAAMVVVYGRILVTVRTSHQQIGTSSIRIPGNSRRTYHVTVMCILHCAAFLLVWTPYAILSFIIMFYIKIPSSLYIASSFFAKVATLINPVLFLVQKKPRDRQYEERV